MALLRKLEIPTLNFAKAAKFRMGHPGAVGCVALLLVLAGCRNDMHDQPRMKTYAMSDFYADLRSERPPVEGTVARGQLHEDTYFYTGKIGANPGDYMPFPVTEAVLAGGRERFNIYCAPCHSRLGDGQGMIPSRGFKQPPTYHQDRLRKAPLGYFFDVMTNARRSLENCGVHSRSAIKSERKPGRRWRAGCPIAIARI